VWRKACRHTADADLAKLIEEGRGDVPIKDLHFRYSNYRGSLIEFVVTVKPDFIGLR
jgi:hypothetical protein